MNFPSERGGDCKAGGPYRVVMVAACPLPYPRGTPIRIHRLANALAERGHEVHVTAYHLGEPDGATHYHLHRIPRVPTYHKVTPGPTWQKLLVLDPLLAATLRRVIRRFDPQIIHAHHFEGLLAALWANRRSRIPLIFDVHTLLEAELPYYRMGLTRGVKTRLAGWLDRRLPLRADHVVAVSLRLRDKLLQLGRLSPDRISVIPSGVGVDHFAGEPSRTGPAGIRTLIFAGNMAPYQGIEFMLDAFAELARGREGVRLKVVTEGDFAPYHPQVRRLGIRDRIEIARVGFGDLPRHLAEADVALNPRMVADGLPQKILNYMAAGKPIVSFAGSANMLVHERTALIVPDGNVAGFTRAIERLLDDPELAERLGGNARREASTSLTWDAAAAKLEALYRRLLERLSG